MWQRKKKSYRMTLLACPRGSCEVEACGPTEGEGDSGIEEGTFVWIDVFCLEFKDWFVFRRTHRYELYFVEWKRLGTREEERALVFSSLRLR